MLVILLSILKTTKLWLKTEQFKDLSTSKNIPISNPIIEQTEKPNETKPTFANNPTKKTNEEGTN